MAQKQLKNVDQLSHEDFLELTHILNFKLVDADTDIYRYNSIPNSFYIIIYGCVQRLGRNPNIPDWNWAKKMVDALKDWKEKTIDNPAKNILSKLQK